jgi:thiaminase/transcriptional activator TenA
VTAARTLWEENGDLAAVALRHPFLRGLANGSLPREHFAGYVAQDAFFLESFARAYALALARSPDRAGIEAFSDLLTGVREELRLHASYAGRWGVDLSEVRPVPATLAYTDFLLATAAAGSVGQICAAMTPCMRLYAYLGRELAGTRTSDTYAEWIDAYADPGFEALASRLESLLDTYLDDLDRARGTYRRAMHLEVAFFDAAVD